MTFENTNIVSLKGTLLIAQTFAKGKKYHTSNSILALYFAEKTAEKPCFRIGVTAPKKMLKRAVKRNRAKRLLRVCLVDSLKNIQLPDTLLYDVCIFAIWKAKFEKPMLLSLKQVRDELQPSLKRIEKKLVEQINIQANSK